MADNKQTKKAMSPEMAQQEFYEFLKLHVRKPKSIDEVSEDYADSIDALEDGRLQFTDGVPVYTLMHPVKTENGEILHDKMTLKTRVLPNTASSLAAGIDLDKNASKYSLVVISHIIGVASIRELDLFHKFDYAVLRQLALLFM